MAKVDLLYLWAPQGRHKVYWFYRRGPVVQECCPSLTEGQAKAVIKKWLETGVLKIEDREDKDRNERPTLIVGKRPGDTWDS